MIILKQLKVENFKLLGRVDLVFPRRGSVLVEGLNESGKSTLFESVFFGIYGVPLVAEGRGRGNLDSTIRYGDDSMSVELTLEVDETLLEIRRSVRRSRSSQARLTVRRPGEPEQEVTGVLAVNARIVEELGGLDSEALLNSCFVEQKKLSKLEDLASGQRRDSLRKLLNLDRLTTVAERLRVTPQDERALAEAKTRLDLAEVAAALPVVAAEREGLEGALRGDGGSAGVRAPGEGWRDTAERLRELRGTIEARRKRGVLFAIGAAVLAVVTLGMYLAGVQQILSWLVPIAVVLALLAWRSYGGAKDLGREIAPLEKELHAHRDVMVARTGELEGQRERVERALGVQGGNLVLEECLREVERLSHQIAVKRRAGAIVEGAMERIVRLVLPNTERNLGQILPLLTAGRYHEARIGEDYQIQVWDDSAGRYVSKSIFSGGAKDQFSLALRLAFALATLPEELGTTPGFIFLDEPLSSFDGPRTEALVRLLTEGQVASSFSQIFVISHNRSFDLNAFQYRLTMREGRVVESNLPKV